MSELPSDQFNFQLVGNTVILITSTGITLQGTAISQSEYVQKFAALWGQNVPQSPGHALPSLQGAFFLRDAKIQISNGAIIIDQISIFRYDPQRASLELIRFVTLPITSEPQVTLLTTYGSVVSGQVLLEKIEMRDYETLYERDAPSNQITVRNLENNNLVTGIIQPTKRWNPRSCPLIIKNADIIGSRGEKHFDIPELLSIPLNKIEGWCPLAISKIAA